MIPSRGAEPGRGTGRERQRGRTRRALLNAATAMIASGRTPSIAEVADAADVSRRTAYRYFPTQEQLLVEAALEGLRSDVVRAVTGDADRPDDVEGRLDRTVLELQRRAVTNESLLRTMIRLTVGSPISGGPAEPAARRRGYRRLEWIELALAPAREQLGEARFRRLVSALAVCLGIDSLIVLRDICGLSEEQAEEVARWTARALWRQCLAESSGDPVHAGGIPAGSDPTIQGST